MRKKIDYSIYFEFLDYEVTNANLKKRLIERFGDEICFSYPKNKNKAVMFFSSSIKTEKVVDKLRNQNPIRECAQLLKEECIQYDFKLEVSYKTSEDLLLSYNNWMTNRLPNWETFFNELLPFHRQSNIIQRKCGTVFQILYNLVHNATKVSPASVWIAETVHDVTRSKKLIEILHRLGICVHYKEVLNIDTAIAENIIDKTGENRVPVSDSITSTDIVQGAMDNFDHDENTLSGKDPLSESYKTFSSTGCQRLGLSSEK